MSKTKPQHNYSFYDSIDFYVGGKQIIVYPDFDAPAAYRGYGYDQIQQHLETLIAGDNKYFEDMSYGITFLWNLEGAPMLDFWKFKVNYVDDRSGPLADVRVYREFTRQEDLEVASGNTLLVLGIEEELRRKSRDLKAYLTGDAPQLPFNLQVNASFVSI